MLWAFQQKHEGQTPTEKLPPKWQWVSFVDDLNPYTNNGFLREKELFNTLDVAILQVSHLKILKSSWVVLELYGRGVFSFNPQNQVNQPPRIPVPSPEIAGHMIRAYGFPIGFPLLKKRWPNPNQPWGVCKKKSTPTVSRNDTSTTPSIASPHHTLSPLFHSFRLSTVQGTFGELVRSRHPRGWKYMPGSTVTKKSRRGLHSRKWWALERVTNPSKNGNFW